MKILTCSCSVEQFNQGQNEYVKKLQHFHCQCNDSHFSFVHTCKNHPFIASRIPEMELRCTCAICGPNEICNFCVQVKYLLNFRAYKLCVKKIPNSIQPHLVLLDKFFDSIPNCGPFFVILVTLERLIFT